MFEHDVDFDASVDELRRQHKKYLSIAKLIKTQGWQYLMKDFAEAKAGLVEELLNCEDDDRSRQIRANHKACSLLEQFLAEYVSNLEQIETELNNMETLS